MMRRACLFLVLLLVQDGSSFSGRSVATRSSELRATVEKQSSPPKGDAKIPSARYLAAYALQTKGFSVDRLENHHQYDSLSTRDRAFARLLVSTTERRNGQIDAILNHCLRKSMPKRSMVPSILRIGICQLVFLDVAPHAACGETVEALKEFPRVPQAHISLANAILRRVSREGAAMLDKTDVLENVDEWLREAWVQDWGVEATQRIVEAAMEESPRCLTVKQGHSVDELEDVELLPQGSVRVLSPPPGSLVNWPGYQDGIWWLQDPSATLPARVLCSLLSPGSNVVDLCSAPGGKTAQLIDDGHKVTAVEVSKRRVGTLKQNLHRLGMECEIVVKDGKDYVPEELVQGVLLDAPCSATGTGSKRPDILRRDSEMEDLLQTQFDLATHAIDDILSPGGMLVYATCSLLKRESEDQVERLLSREVGAKVENVPILPEEVPGFEDSIDANGWVRVLPGTNGISNSDGFFVARLKRVD